MRPSDRATPRPATGSSGPVAPAGLRVLDPGAQMLIQDAGRPGYAALGVPRSGAVDRPSYDLANRLVGNEVGAPGLEFLATGVDLQAEGSLRIAVTGADLDVLVDGRPAPTRTPLSLRSGARVTLTAARTGLRGYLAVAGGIDVPAVLGSAATDVLSGLGPDPVAAGDLLRINPMPPGTRTPIVVTDVGVPPVLARPVRLLPGPRCDWFTTAEVAVWSAQPFVVEASSNRIGIRLRGEQPLRRRTDRPLPNELPSEPMILGAVQIPPEGQPVIFLNDHPTTGGYPVVAVVRGADLPVLAQARPGDTVRLVPERDVWAEQLRSVDRGPL